LVVITAIEFSKAEEQARSRKHEKKRRRHTPSQAAEKTDLISVTPSIEAALFVAAPFVAALLVEERRFSAA
jgi:hypothetical protein